MQGRKRISPFPVFLNLDGKPCAVFGGGKVAERKIRSLLKAGARVSCFAEKVTPKISALARRKMICCRKVRLRGGPSVRPFLREPVLVFAATSSSGLNTAIYRECGKRKILVNVADVPRLSNFISPAVFSRGALKVVVSTGGKSPELAKTIRKKMNGFLGPEYGRLLEFMSGRRSRILETVPFPAKRKKLFRELASPGFLACFRKKDSGSARRYYEKLLKKERLYRGSNVKSESET